MHISRRTRGSHSALPVGLLVGMALSVMAGRAHGQGVPPIHWMAGGHYAGVHGIALSTDNTRLATASFDTTVKLFDTASTLLLRTMVGHDVVALSVAFSSDGTRLVSGGFDGARVWNPQTGELVGTLSGHTDAVNAVAFSPDGTKIATASGDTTVKLWDAGSLSLIRTLSGHSDWVYAVAFSPDGTMVASGSGDGTIRLWRVSDGASLGTVPAHAGAVLSVRFSPDGALLASAGTDDAVKLWRVSDGANVASYTGQTMYVFSTIFSPDGSLLASGAGDGTVVLRRVSDGIVERTILASGGVHSLAFTSDGATLYVGSDDGMVTAYSVADGTVVTKLTRHSGSVNGLVVSPDGQRAVSVADDGKVVIHRLADGNSLLAFDAHSNAISSVAVSPDGAVLCTTSYDNNGALWNASDGTPIATLVGHTDVVLCSAFSPDGLTVATGASDSTIRLWRVSDGVQVGILSGHAGAVRGVAFSPDGQWLASASADGTVRKWRLSDGTEVWRATAADPVAYCVSFSPDGNTIATGAAASSSGTLKLWNAADGSLIASASSDPIRSLAFSPNGLLLATGGDHDSEGRLQFWQASNLGLLQTFDQETGTCLGSTGVNTVAFSPDNTGLIYGRFDGTVVFIDNPFWPVPTNLAVADIPGQVGELVTLRATLTAGLGGGPVLGKTITFEVAGTEVGNGVSAANGEASCEFRIPEALGVGTQSIAAAFAGDSAYAGSSGSATLTINKANTAILVSDAAGILGDPVTLRAKLQRTTDDAPLAGRVLRFSVESTSAGSAVTDGTGYASVDYTIPVLPGAGERLITVTFDGDANHRECTAYGILTAQKRPTDTVVAARSARIGELIPLTADVTFRGAGVEGLEVEFFVDGAAVGTAFTDASGIAEVGYLVPELGGVGSRTISASFAGTAIYAASSGTATLDVVRTESRLYVPDITRTVPADGAAVMRAYLLRTTDKGGIADRIVEFYVDGTLADTQITDSNGRATGYWQVPSTVGTADVLVHCVFAGDVSYFPCDGTGRLTVVVQKTPTNLWVLPRIGVRGAGTYLRAYLRKATDWSWLPGQSVAFSVAGTYVGSVTTNSDGRASVFYRIPKEMASGFYTISANFAGDATYLPATGESVLLVL